MTIDNMIKEMQENVAMELFSPTILALESSRGIVGWVADGRWTAECEFYIKRENGAVAHKTSFQAMSFTMLIETIYNEWQKLK